MNNKIELGMRVKCIITGVEGIATARITYISKCSQIQLSLPVNDKGELGKEYWIDEPYLEIVNKEVIEGFLDENEYPGGPTIESPIRKHD